MILRVVAKDHIQIYDNIFHRFFQYTSKKIGIYPIITIRFL